VGCEGRPSRAGGGGQGGRSSPCLRIDSLLFSAQAPSVSARRQAASRRSARSLWPSRLIPRQDRTPWWGCGREASRAATTGAVGGPLVAAQGSKRWGVHSAYCGCARGICAATVRWRPLWDERRWLAPRVPLAPRSTTEALRRPSSGWRPTVEGTEEEWPAPSTWSSIWTRASCHAASA
jgi:hypothetical protein